jgi:hypothetical protein
MQMLKQAQGRYVVNIAVQLHEVPPNHAFTLHEKTLVE